MFVIHYTASIKETFLPYTIKSAKYNKSPACFKSLTQGPLNGASMLDSIGSFTDTFTLLAVT